MNSNKGSINFNFIDNSLPELSRPIAIPDHTDDLKASAVMLVLHQIEQNWQLLLTTRASHLNHHAGQISFPGGRFENDDQHLMETAIRETEEEIGLSRNEFNVVSQLDEHPTLTGFRIFPYVAIIEQLPDLIIDKGEVDDVFSVPLDFLLDKNNQILESAFYKGRDYDYYKIIWQDRLIWGATARMIVNLSNYF